MIPDEAMQRALVAEASLAPSVHNVQPAALSLTNAKASSPAVLFIAFTSTPIGFHCGTLAAAPVGSQLVVTTSGAGANTLSWGSWPGGLSGLTLYWQYAVQDAAAVCGVALSNALRSDVP